MHPMPATSDNSSPNLPPTTDSPPARPPLTYAAAGVDIEAGDRMVGLIQASMRSTYGPRVLGRHGAFAGLFRLDFNETLFRRNYREPVLIACTDGVGSKVKLAAQLGIYHSLGRDLVAMSINDMIVQGAEPLFFLDYIGTHKLDPQRMADLVAGVAEGCRIAGCALLGGETAELPDLYAAGDFDLAGFGVGVCELHRVIDGSRTRPGDVVLGLASTGVHSNGYSLVRAVVERAGLNLKAVYDELTQPPPVLPRVAPGGEAHGVAGGGMTLGEVLLTPTRIYAKPIVSVLRKYRVKQVVTGMSHITGGGLAANLERSLSPGVDAVLDKGAWPRPPVFQFLRDRGGIDEAEMFRVFNMGIGYVVIVRPYYASQVAYRLTRLGERVTVLGELVQGTGGVRWQTS